MKKTVPAILMITALPLFLVSAQNAQRPKQLPQGGRPAQLEKQKAVLAEKKAELKDKLEAEPAGEPSADLNVSEFQLKRNDLKGKIVELTFDKVVSLKQAGKEGYIAMVTYENPRLAEGVSIIVPADGLKFFEELSRPGLVRRESVYIQVLNGSTLKALGTRYREDKPEGERYCW